MRTSFLSTIFPLLFGVASLGAQESATTMHVTPAGVFAQTAIVPDRGHDAQRGPNPSPAGTRWVYANPPAIPWITESTSVGNHGTFAWLGQNLNGQRLSFVATTDDAGNPPAFIYEVAAPGASITVKAADKAPACAVASQNGGTSTYTLDYYRSASSTPEFSVSRSSSFEIAISDDGRYIAAGTSTGATSAAVDVYDARSATPTVPIATLAATSNAFRHLDISGDGSTVLLATHTRDHVFDVATQSELFSASTVSHDAHTINRDGKVFARGGFSPVRAWVRTGATYNEVLTFSDATLGFPVYTACDVSADGSTFVAAAYDASSNERMRIHCFALTPTSSNRLWTWASDGTGGRQSVPQSVSLSDNGKYIAVADWGTEFNLHPEVMLFDRDAGSVPIAVIDTPGSAFDVDLSGDGQFLVAGTKAVHANVFGNGGEGYSFDRGNQDHRLIGTVGLNRTFHLKTGGTPGETIAFVFGTALGTPIPVPGIGGTLDLDPAGILLVPIVGTVPASGVHDRAFGVPPDAALVGAELFTQALRLGPPHEFENTVRLAFTQ